MDGPAEFSPSCPEVAASPDLPTQDNEFQALPRKSSDDEAAAVRKLRRAERRKKNFLLQAAGVLLGIVLITSSMGIDLLGEQLSGDTLVRLLRSLGAGSGTITVSMLWNTADDADLHVVTPGGEEIYYGNPRAGGGELDVDMQVSSVVDDPVENIYFQDPERGTYNVIVENYSDRTPDEDSLVLIRVSVRGKAREYRVILNEYRKFVCSFTY